MEMFKDKFNIETAYRFSLLDTSSNRANEIEQKITKQLELGKLSNLDYKKYLNELRAESVILKQTVEKNLVTLAGRKVLVDVLGGVGTYTGVINYCGLGSSDSAPDSSNVALGSELARKPIASVDESSVASGIVTLNFFFNKGDFSGSVEEFGLFIDGTTLVDTGQLFSRGLTSSTFTKTISNTLTIEIQLTANE